MFQVAVKNVFPDVTHLPLKIKLMVEKCLCSLGSGIASLRLLKHLFEE